MTYSVAVRAHNKEQSVEILDFINKNIPEFKTLFPEYSINGYQWSNDLPYIADYPHIGFNLSMMDCFQQIYTYSILYNVAIKFNLHTIINNIPVVIIDYDSDYTFFLAEKNPFDENDERTKGFILIKDGLIQKNHQYYFLKKIFHLIPNQKDNNKIKQVIKNINN